MLVFFLLFKKKKIFPSQICYREQEGREGIILLPGCAGVLTSSFTHSLSPWKYFKVKTTWDSYHRIERKESRKCCITDVKHVISRVVG